MNYKEYPHNPNYLVYNDGRIYSVPRKGPNNSNRKGRFLKTKLDKQRYPKISLWEWPDYKTVAVHRLVAETWIPNPNDLPEVNHKDGNKCNNNVNNLEWCTPLENIQHAMQTRLITPEMHPHGEAHCCAKLTESDVISIRNRYKPYDSVNGGGALAREFDVDPSTIRYIITRKIWKHIP